MSEEEKKAIENIEKELNKKYEVVPLYKDFSINSPMNIVQKHYNDTDIKIILNLISKLQSDIEIKDKVIDLLIDDVYDNDNFWKLKCGFERIEKGKEKEYIKERFYKKAEEEKC